ncbi:MAG: hypothetical protein ACREAA_12645 [Candidatus Polarisedimenticolia bacterium]
MRARRGFVGICTLLLMSAPAVAKVAAQPFETLVAESGHIVLAKVSAVEGRGKKRLVAKADVLEVWKGPDLQEVMFSASPAWTCDISEAKVGETVVLFLGVAKPGELVYISHSGRGRMPVREVKGRFYADIWHEVILPEATPTIEGPGSSVIRSIDLLLLKDLVLEHAKTDDEE